MDPTIAATPATTARNGVIPCRPAVPALPDPDVGRLTGKKGLLTMALPYRPFAVGCEPSAAARSRLFQPPAPARTAGPPTRDRR